MERDFEIEPRAGIARAGQRQLPDRGQAAKQSEPGHSSEDCESFQAGSPCPSPCRYSDYRGPSARRQAPALDQSPDRTAERDPDRQPAREPAREPRTLSDLEIKLLSDVGRFRVIRAQSLEQVYFPGRARACADALVRLRSEGLIEDRIVRRRARRPGSSPEKIRLLSLTKAGRKLASNQTGSDRSQVLYAGLVKEREALHDSNLYPVYLAHAARLDSQGAVIRRVRLDFELKRTYLRELRRREKNAPKASPDIVKTAVAAQFELPIVDGKVQFPDLRIEYEMPGSGMAKADIELATASYHHRHIAQKARAGFTIYADPAERGHLGATIRDDHDLMAEILSF